MGGHHGVDDDGGIFIRNELVCVAGFLEEDTAHGICQLRNHAPALVDCARLLRQWHNSETEFTLPVTLEEVEAALKRLEEIK